MLLITQTVCVQRKKKLCCTAVVVETVKLLLEVLVPSDSHSGLTTNEQSAPSTTHFHTLPALT